MSGREYFWVDTERAVALVQKVGLDGIGALNLIAAQFYCGEPLADSFGAMSLHCVITPEEWDRVRAKLIEAGELEVQDGLLVPTGDWHKPEFDS